MSESSQPQIKNRLLATLSSEVYQRLLPHLEPVELPHGKVLYEIGDVIEHDFSCECYRAVKAEINEAFG